MKDLGNMKPLIDFLSQVGPNECAKIVDHVSYEFSRKAIADTDMSSKEDAEQINHMLYIMRWLRNSLIGISVEKFEPVQ